VAIDRNDLLHVESCALIALLLLTCLPWWAACAITLAVGIGKELYDKEHGGVCTWSDIVFDIVGIMLGMGVYLIWIITK
jgi:hypothetical protein